MALRGSAQLVFFLFPSPMLRTAFLFFCLLGLASSVATAGPSTRHPSRGNFVPVYKTYRYHSRERQGLLSFLHFGSRHPGTTARHHGRARSARPARKHTSGLF